MDIRLYAVVIGIVSFWAVSRILIPKKPRYASDDFIDTEDLEETERKLKSTSSVHQLVYPIYEMVQRMNPTTSQAHDNLKELLERAGEFDTSVESVQIAQIVNALVYPIVFGVIAFLFGAEYRMYIFIGGILVGLYMYNAPIRNLKMKQKYHNEQILQEFTKFVTVYLMFSSGNYTPYDALKVSVEKVKNQSKALGFYLKELDKDLFTSSPEKALSKFSERMNRPYVDRFVNNVLLSMQQANDENSEINMRLRETLNELQDDTVNTKISQMKTMARIPIYANVVFIAIYMIVLLGVSLFLMF